ncbi:MAG: hypothetical protein MI975_09065 [Cytophagales bacterium]|nr:hypothetical protein [Cytophagales bacterium]
MNRIVLLMFLVLLTSSQCSRWQKYSRHIKVELVPNILSPQNDSISCDVSISIENNSDLKFDSVYYYFHYLREGMHMENSENEVGRILLTKDKMIGTEKINCKHETGRNVYMKQFVYRRGKTIISPYIVVGISKFDRE